MIFCLVLLLVYTCLTLDLNLAWDAPPDLNPVFGGYRLYFGNADTYMSVTNFPFLGDYTANKGPKSPQVLPMSKAEFNVTSGITTIHSSLKYLPSCVNITITVTAYNATTVPQTETPYPCSTGSSTCAESVPANIVYVYDGTAEKQKCIVTYTADNVKVACSFSVGAYGGTMPGSGMFFYAAHNVKIGELLSKEFDGNNALEGPSPFFIDGTKLQSMPQGIVTLPKGTSGRYCFLFRLSCIVDDTMAKAEILANGKIGILGATCVDIIPMSGATAAPATTMTTTTGEGGVTESTIATTAAVPTTQPRLYDTVKIPTSCMPGENLCSCDEQGQCNDLNAECRGEPVPICIDRECDGSRGCKCDSNLRCGNCPASRKGPCAPDDVCIVLVDGTSLCAARPEDLQPTSTTEAFALVSSANSMSSFALFAVILIAAL